MKKLVGGIRVTLSGTSVHDDGRSETSGGLARRLWKRKHQEDCMKSREAGFSFLFVIAITLALTLLVQSLLEEASVQVDIATAATARAQAQASADGAVRAAISLLAKDLPVRAAQIAEDLPGDIELVARSHAGRVNPNNATRADLLTVARAAGLEQPAQFAEDVISFRQAFDAGGISWQLGARPFSSIVAATALVPEQERDLLSGLLTVDDTRNGERVFDIIASVTEETGVRAERHALVRFGSETIILDWR